MTYPFEGEDEERRALAWIVSKLRQVKEFRIPDQKESGEELRVQCAARVEAIKHDGPRLSNEWYDELWDNFVFAVSGVWLDEADETWDAPHTWGEWNLDAAQEILVGHSSRLIRTRIPKGGGSAVHWYSKPPPDIKWALMPIEQKGLRFFVGKARVAEIDAVCSVPQLPAEMTSEEAGERVLNPRRGENEWQRRVEANRILSIKNFIGSSGNIIANSAILYAPRHPAVSSNPRGKVRIDFRRFLQSARKEWTDHEGDRDLRPIWLIDGQHRTRGLAQSEEGVRLEIPIILFPPDFSLGQSAKIFAEINTLQKKLTPLHTLFMQHRFHIPSPVAKRDFLKPWDPRKPKTRESRANHLSYECAAYLTSSNDGPLRGRIRILDQNPPRLPIIQASQWVDFSRFWYLDGGIYGPECPETQDEMNVEVENFFRAFVAMCNHDGWRDGEPRWSPNARNKGLVQKQGPSQALLKLYPTAWEIAKRESSTAPISERRFAEVLRPLKWVDWLDSRLHTVFGGSGERPRSALRVWLEAAVRNGKSYPLEEVMANDLHSKPGRGMLASPGNGTIRVAGSVQWPELDKPAILVAEQPANTLPGSRWGILDSNNVNRSGENPVVFARAGKAELELRHEPWMDNVKWLDIRADWYNTVMPPGKATLRLERRAAAR